MEIGHERQVLAADEIVALIRDELHGVEKAINIESATSSDIVKPISKYLQQTDRIHLRAALLLVCARFAGGGGRMAIQLGAVVEMMHAAALIHSENISMEQARSGWPSTNMQSANCAPVLAGDWLYLGAFRVALQERVLHMVIGVAQKMVSADLIQLDLLGDICVTEADCIDMADRKTASLFSVCGELGAVAAEADARDGKKLTQFAWNLGMAFQLINDGLDFVVHESAPGKPAGSDLKNGKVTMPMVYALEQATDSERKLVAQVLEDRSYDSVPFANVLALVDRYNGIQRTHARAKQFLDCAWQIVTEFPDSLGRRTLFKLIELISEHTSCSFCGIDHLPPDF